MRSLRSLLTAALLAALALAPPTLAAQAVRTVTVSPSALTLGARDTAVVTATPLGPSGKKVPATVTFSTSDPGVISVTRQGTGKARVVVRAADSVTRTVRAYATAGGVTTSALITVPGRSPTPPPDTQPPPPPPPPPPPDTLRPPPPDTTVGGGGGGTPPPPPPVDTAGATPPSLPRAYVPPTTFPVARTVTIAAGDTGALRRALATAQSGDEIVLAFGTYVGWWELGAHAGAGWVTVRSADTVGTMRAVLLTPGRNVPALHVHPGAHRWRLVNVEAGALPAVRDLNTLVFLGARDGQTKITDDHPSDLVFDRVRMAAHDSLDLRRCLLGNADRWALLRSDLVCHGASADAMAVGAWTLARGVLIEGNRIAGSGHGILFGGSDAADSTLLPRDIVVRGNRIYKPVAWKGVYQAKTLIEFKVGRRVLLEGNVLEHHWASAQTGFALLLKSVNQDGAAPWSVVEDVTVRHNILRHSAAGINLAARPEGHPAVPMARVAITGNLLYGIGGENGRMVQLVGDMRDVRISGNTLLHAGYANSALTVDRGAEPAQRVVIADNLMTAGEYAWHSPVGSGTAALTHLAGTTWRAERNVLIGWFPEWKFPAGTRGAATLAAVGFVDAPAGDFTLRADSPFRGVGADVARVRAATAGVRQADPAARGRGIPVRK